MLGFAGRSGQFDRRVHMITNCLVAVVMAVTLVGLSASPGRASGLWYVATTGNNTNDCLTPATACKTITHAINKALPNDIISIASGLYAENVQILKSVALMGASADSTFIDGSELDETVLITGGVSTSLSFLTIQNGANITGGGGGIRNFGTLILADTVITGNVANNGGGIRNNGILTISDSKIISNSASTDGGGIDSGLGSITTIDRSTISNNLATYGGAIRNNSALTVTASVLSGNSASTNGGGIYMSISSTMLLKRSAIVGNLANNDGGGIFVTRNVPSPLLVNVTIGANTAGAAGGGIFNESNMTLTNVTLNANDSAVGKGSNLYLSSTLQLNNTIVANGLSGNCAHAAAFGITSLGNNLDSGNTCALNGTGDVTRTNPLLAALSVDTVLGNLTPTYALERGSPAIDAGNNLGCPPTDQRSVVRPIDGDRNGTATCDIGAYEFNYFFSLYLPMAART